MTEPLNAYASYDAPRSESLTRPMIVYGLFLLTLFTGGLSAILGLIIAYVSRVDASPAAQSHFTFQIRSFWMHLLIFPFGILLIVLGIPLLLVGVGLLLIVAGGLMLALAHLWYLVRVVVGLIHAANGRSYPDPRTWLI